MTAPDRTYDRVRFHRGSRGFAAFVTGLNAVHPPRAGAVRDADPGPVPAGRELVRDPRRWCRHRAHRRGRRADPRSSLERRARRLPRRGRHRRRRLRGARRRDRLEILGAERGTAVGFFIWMIGSWLVATRFALAAVQLHAADAAPGPAACRAARPGRPAADRAAQAAPARRRPRAPARRVRCRRRGSSIRSRGACAAGAQQPRALPDLDADGLTPPVRRVTHVG